MSEVDGLFTIESIFYKNIAFHAHTHTRTHIIYCVCIYIRILAYFSQLSYMMWCITVANERFYSTGYQ